MEAETLVALAMKKAKADKPADLARALELGAYASLRRVARWLEGTNEPDYKATLALLRAAGLLRTTPATRRPSTTSAQSAPQLAHLESLEAKADEALGGIGDILVILRGSQGESDAGAQGGSP